MSGIHTNCMKQNDKYTTIMHMPLVHEQAILSYDYAYYYVNMGIDLDYIVTNTPLFLLFSSILVLKYSMVLHLLATSLASRS